MKNELIELPELDKIEIFNRALKQSLSVYDCVDGSVSPEIVKSLLKLVENALKSELSKDRFKYLKQELYIKQLEQDIENLKRQIRK